MAKRSTKNRGTKNPDIDALRRRLVDAKIEFHRKVNELNSIVREDVNWSFCLGVNNLLTEINNLYGAIITYYNAFDALGAQP